MYLILNTTKLIEIYITCDDFAKKMEQYQLSEGQIVREEKMSCLEIMAIVIYYRSGEPSPVWNEMLQILLSKYY